MISEYLGFDSDYIILGLAGVCLLYTSENRAGTYNHRRDQFERIVPHRNHHRIGRRRQTEPDRTGRHRLPDRSGPRRLHPRNRHHLVEPEDLSAVRQGHRRHHRLGRRQHRGERHLRLPLAHLHRPGLLPVSYTHLPNITARILISRVLRLIESV